ncbi:MAG: IS66 family insertion sequence element accessory protein TnpB [Firmicutes bacterium]|nr:IS66 family insertion sequence element accessory protein TnpB [Bacillota bacterium]
MAFEELRKQWADRVAAFKASGQSTTEWCAAHNVKPSQLRYWLRKEKKAQAKTSWQPLELEDTDTPLVVKVGQVAVEVKPGFDPKLLQKVLKTLLAQ